MGGCDTSNPNGDPDDDGLTNAQEQSFGTDPCDSDTDDDSCTDGAEKGPDPERGGQRNPLNHWDFYDVNGTRKVDAVDTALVRSRFDTRVGDPGYGTVYDRSPSQPWGGPPDGVINAIDTALVRAQFRHSCR